ncbi:MAG TPA: hypothetical protein VG929_09925 [Actinomycetota bacterium]|nr:hypothetical protein [Actinomycetota bacterium]
MARKTSALGRSSQKSSKSIVLRPFRGPRGFLTNASIATHDRELVITDHTGHAHRFDLDHGGPYRVAFVRGRLWIVEADGRAILVTRAHVWDTGDLWGPLLTLFGWPLELDEEPPLRPDGVVMQDRHLWDRIPKVALGPLVVAPFLLRYAIEWEWMSQPVAFALMGVSVVGIVVVGSAQIWEARTFQRQRIRKAGSRSYLVINQRGDFAGELDLHHAEALRLEQIAFAPPMGTEAGVFATPVDSSGEPVGPRRELSLTPADLLELAEEAGIPLELAPFDRVARDKTVELRPYGDRGNVKLSITPEEVVITDRGGRVQTFPRSGDQGPARVLLAYLGWRHDPALLAKAMIVDGADRVILETPLAWWAESEGMKSLFSLARTLEVPMQLVDGRWGRNRRPVAPGGVRYVDRPLAWYSIWFVGCFLVMFAASFIVFAIHDLLFELPDGFMITVVALALGTFFFGFGIAGLRTGKFRVWSQRG